MQVFGNGLSYSSGTSYTFVQSTGARSGTYSSITDDLDFFNATLVYGANSVGFILNRDTSGFASAATTPNQQAVANYIIATSPGAVGDYNTVLDALSSLPSSQIGSAFDQLDGSAYATMGAVGVQNATNMIMSLRRLTVSDTLRQPAVGGTAPLVYDDSYEGLEMRFVNLRSNDGVSLTPVIRFEDRPRRPWNGFSVGYGSWNNGIANGSYGAGGSITSIYRDLYTGIRLGAFAGYNYMQLKQGIATQSVSNNNFTFGSFFRAEDDDRYMLAISSFGFDSYEGSRSINFGTINRTATSDYDGWQTTQYVEAGMKEVGWPFDIDPFVGLQYVFLSQDAFTETGADSVNLVVDKTDVNSLRSVLGTRLARDYGSLRPEFRAMWLYDFFGTNPVINSTFLGAGGTAFQTQGVNLGRSWAVLGAGATWAVTDRISLAGNYDAMFNDDRAFHMGSGSVQVYW